MATKRWADDTDEMGNFRAELVESQSADGREFIKVITEFKTNEKGLKVKVATRVRVTRKAVRVNQKVKERRGWTKFGLSAGVGPGLSESGVTAIAEDVFLEAAAVIKTDTEKASTAGATQLNVVCRKCGGDHWTRNCPLGEEAAIGVLADKQDEDIGTILSTAGTRAQSSAAPSKSGSYVPPHMRGSGAGGDRDRNEEYRASVRVTNLSEEAREADLHDLFRAFGPIARVSLPKDRMTGLPRGFAFVDFHHQDDAAKAIAKLQGTGFDNLILNVEWARPAAQ